MATAVDVARIALELEGTTAAPHFDRTAYKVKRIYASVGGGTLNLKLTSDEQEFKVMLAPQIFAPISGGWGRAGWTTVELERCSMAELEGALRMAWEHGRASKPKSR